VEKYCTAGRPQITIWPMRIACWVPKATNTHLEYVILIAFSRRQLLHDRASMLRYACSTLRVVLSRYMPAENEKTET
jgi:hypothetical protein